ncbi:MAG: aspartyl-phosphate phosphatase Spo0E family protein [Clostridia bacterium]
MSRQLINGVILMLNDQIVVLRNKLDTLLLGNADYEQIYAVSIELDKLIVQYYAQRRLVKR